MQGLVVDSIPLTATRSMPPGNLGAQRQDLHSASDPDLFCAIECSMSSADASSTR